MSQLKYEPFYNELAKEHGEQKAYETGYFDPSHHKINWKKHVNLPCTPVNFLAKPKYDNTKLAIIISTGAHCPLHDGHIEMMISAKINLQSEGYQVVGGYLSPGHDEYIKYKNGDNWMSIGQRMDWANKMIKDHQWLSIDPWEGVFAPGAVNFTSVVYRLQQYLKKFYDHYDRTKIFFVCGKDNARFLEPFLNTEIGTVVVNRPNYKWDQYADLKSDNVIFATNLYNENSSTRVRETDEYKAFRIKNKKQLFLRMNYNFVEKQIQVLAKKEFSQVWTLDIEEQKGNFFRQIIQDKIVINLDSEIIVDHENVKPLEISRFYDNFGQKNLKHINRIGSKSVKDQIVNLIKDKYIKECYLFDDDICSGGTMDFAEWQLNNYGIKVLGRLSFASGQSSDKEVLDTKDFLIGYLNGGLTTKIKKEYVRVPYVYPFICPTVRASVTNPLSFSIEVWKINMDFWKDKEATIYNTPSLHFLTKLGFKQSDTIYSVCEYYYNFLSTLPNYEQI